MTIHIHALDGYRAENSFIHHLDARVKLVSVMCFVLATALTPDGAWLAFALSYAIIFGVTLASRLGVRFVLRRSAVALPFALAAVTVVFSTPGEALIRLRVWRWHLALTDAGVARFLSIVLKSWLSVQMAVLLTASTRFPDLLYAMRSLRIPKVLVAIVGFAYRYIFVIGDEVMRMLRARAARSGVPSSAPGARSGRRGGSILWRARVTGGMAGNLFLRSIARSERIYDAMLARGYDGEIRTLRPPMLQWGELLMGLMFVLLLVAIQLLVRRV